MTLRYGWSRASSRSSWRSEEHTSELQSHSDLVCRLLLEKKQHRRGNVAAPCQHRAVREAGARRLTGFPGDLLGRGALEVLGHRAELADSHFFFFKCGPPHEDHPFPPPPPFSV